MMRTCFELLGVKGCQKFTKQKFNSLLKNAQWESLTTIQGLQIQREILLEQIEESVSPDRFLLITGPKGIGKSALIKIYLEKHRYPWLAFRGEDLNPCLSLDAFSTKHGFLLDKEMLARFNVGEGEKKVLYVDAIEEISQKNGAFLDLILLFREMKWAIILSSNNNSVDWLENVEGLTKQEIKIIKIPLLNEEVQEMEGCRDSLTPFIKKYPILSEIRWERIFQPYYYDLFENPLYLRFFCEEMEKLQNPRQHFNSIEASKKFEQKIWKKVVCNEEECSERGISELRHRIIIDMTINQACGASTTSITQTDDSKKLKVLGLLKKDQLLGRNEDIFTELSFKMYFQEMIQDWLKGKNLDILSDQKLGGFKDFDRIFSDFLVVWLNDKFEVCDRLLTFLKHNFLNFEAFAACLFQHVLRVGKVREAEKMLDSIPDLANLPVFLDGHRIQFPINVAIHRLDIELITLLHQHGAKLRSPLEGSTIYYEKGKGARPRNLVNLKSSNNDPAEIYYYCCIPLREAIQRPHFSHSDGAKKREQEKRKVIIKFLIEKGARFNDPADLYHDQLSLLHIAVENQDLEIVSLLLEHKMETEVYQQFSLQTPLGEALEIFLNLSKTIEEAQVCGNPLYNPVNLNLAKEIFEILVRNGAKDTSLMHQDALRKLVREKHYDLAKILLEEGHRPEQCISELKDCVIRLMEAGFNRFLLAKILLEKGHRPKQCISELKGCLIKLMGAGFSLEESITYFGNEEEENKFNTFHYAIGNCNDEDFDKFFNFFMTNGFGVPNSSEGYQEKDSINFLFRLASKYPADFLDCVIKL